MTEKEVFQGFVYSNISAIHSARYAIESEADDKILLMTDRQFKEIRHGDDKGSVLNFKDVTSIDHHLTAPEDDDEIESPMQLVIRSEKRNIVITCSFYDYQKIAALFPSASNDEAAE